MKTKFNRVIAAFLTLVMCIGMVFQFGLNAFAATEADVYMMDLPRGSDPNQSGWGHSALTFLNSWSTDASNHTTAKAIGDYENSTAYCIEPGIPLNNGDTLNKKGEDFWDDYPENLNDTISSDYIKKHIGRILQYGWTGKNNLDWKSSNSTHANQMANMLATQFLIWESVVGERNASFGKVNAANSGKDNILEMMSSSHPLRSEILEHYNRIVNEVKEHVTIPSFMQRSSLAAQTYELTWDGNKYSISLTDTNGVLGKYDFSSSASGVSCSVSGNHLTISSVSPPSGTFDIKANKSGARKATIVWTDYTMSNKHSNQIQDVVSYGEDVSDPIYAYLHLKVSVGNAKLVKTSEDGVVSGIKFTVTGNGVNQTVTTGANGEILVENLVAGTYTVTEHSIDRYVPQNSKSITVVGGNTTTVTFSNVLKRGNLQVTKSSEDGFVDKVTFRLSGTSLSGLKVDEYAVTNDKGVATFKDILISGSTPFVLEEVNTAIRYVIPDKQNTVINWKEVTNATVHNALKKFCMTVSKTDKETIQPQGNASLAGAKYGIYNNGTLVDAYETDANGRFTTAYYICGDNWTLREISPSEGYLIDKTVHHVGAEAKLYTVEYNHTANDVTEQVVKGKISLIKHTDDGSTKIETPETGAVFEVFLKSAGSYKNAKESERDKLICDEHGFAQTKDLPYGIYTVHQVSGWEGRELIKDFTVYVSKDGEVYRYLINNANFECYIKVVKTDAETGKQIAYAGAGFQIYDQDGKLVTMTYTYPNVTKISTFYTNDQGYLVTPEKLPYGKSYKLVEVQAPYPYVLDSTPVSFDVVQSDSKEEDGITIIEIVKTDMPQKGRIHIEKTGEVLTGATETNGVYQPVYSVQTLAGAVFDIIADEDIYLNGDLKVKKDTVVDTVTTTKSGAESKLLYLGRYRIEEKISPYGTVLNTEALYAELTYKGQEVSVTKTDVSAYNERQKAQLNLTKHCEIPENVPKDFNPYGGVIFALYAKEDIKAHDGTVVIPAGSLLELIGFDKDGKSQIKTDLPLGEFYCQEYTANNYKLDDTKYDIVFEYTDQTKKIVTINVNSGKPIENKLLRGSLKIIKTFENRETPIENVPFVIEGTTSVGTKVSIEAKTDKNGEILLENLLVGDYRIRELESKLTSGYILSPEQAISVAPDQIAEIIIHNELMKGDLRIIKTFEGKKVPLKDIPFTIIGTTLTGDKYEQTFKTDEEGKIFVEGLLAGSYKVQELACDLSAGYVLSKEQTINIAHQKITELKIENKKIRGKIQIYKYDGKNNAPIQGVVFGIYNEKGELKEKLTTGKNGYALSVSYVYGKYKIIELYTVNGFKLNQTPYELEITENNKIYKLSFKNDRIPEQTGNPKTGDSDAVGLWIVLAGMSCSAIILTLAFAKRRKKFKSKG